MTMPFTVPVTLHGRICETPDTWTIQLETPKTFRPKAGQFVMVPIGDTGLVRCWTVSSTCGSCEFTTLTVRCVPEGKGSNWITKEVPVGARFSISEPMGDFVVDEKDPGPFLLIAAGIGVTPVMSIARELLIHRPGTPVTVLYCARNQESVVFDKLWRTLAECREELTFVPFVKEDPLPGEPTGRLTAERILEFCPDVANRTVYACGSAGFMNSMAEAVIGLGCDPKRVHTEALLP
ncbi:ferredoxin--NADP reductase [Sutterella megalosphaeroides]|uniref:FAD-binding FR-type domain-containing protein n=1 Tax=Sutterella megalosphaeroides TaxID=2494234 RepID=A0A2Z6IEF8_9BURK|nr:FAD-binding oxidoreductase [Sutterella megalosphaeroides]BBF24057.1 hypothetical protein SUTMEG_19480 [Sutterella megalosphaeroides]